MCRKTTLNNNNTLEDCTQPVPKITSPRAHFPLSRAGLARCAKGRASALQHTFFFRRARVERVDEAGAAQPWAAASTLPARHIRAHVSIMMTRKSLHMLSVRTAGRIEGRPDTQQPIEHITRPHDHPRKPIRPSPGTLAPSGPSLAQASAAHLQHWRSAISGSAERALDIQSCYSGCRHFSA